MLMRRGPSKAELQDSSLAATISASSGDCARRIAELQAFDRLRSVSAIMAGRSAAAW